MTMNTTRITTYWNTEDAHTVIEFLDILRDHLWETYGDEIIEMYREVAQAESCNENQNELGFDDEIDC